MTAPEPAQRAAAIPEDARRGVRPLLQRQKSLGADSTAGETGAGEEEGASLQIQIKMQVRAHAKA